MVVTPSNVGSIIYLMFANLWASKQFSQYSFPLGNTMVISLYVNLYIKILRFRIEVFYVSSCPKYIQLFCTQSCEHLHLCPCLAQNKRSVNNC